MGRKREQHDPDRFLSQRAGNFLYKRRVPKDVLDLDERAPIVRISLKTSDRGKARALRDAYEQSDNEFWASLVKGDGTEASKARHKAAVARAKALGFAYRPVADLAATEAVEAILRRIEAVPQGKSEKPAGLALLGAAGDNDQTIRDALQTYFDTIAPDQIRLKSEEQRKRWKAKRLASVETFIALVGNLRMGEIGRDNAQRFHSFYMERIAPPGGAKPSATPNFGNQKIGHLRTLYREWFAYMGMPDRRNPFDKLSFSERKGRHAPRPAFSTGFIRDHLLKPGELAALNDEARNLVLAMIETGARPAELCNLTPSDIRLDADVPFIRVAPRLDPEDPREIKTDSSVRDIPLVGVSLEAMKLHPHGFPRYADASTSLSNLVNKYLRTNKLIEKPRQTLYSLRHAFEDRMKEGGIDEELRRILFGHSIDRPRYGTGGSMAWRRDELLKIALPFDPSIVTRDPELTP